MSYLQKHPKTHVYRFRRAVPKELRDAIGKSEILKSLHTKDLKEAKRRNAEEIVKSDALFEQARSGDAISIEDATALAWKYWRGILSQDYERRADCRPDGWQSEEWTPEEFREEERSWYRRALAENDFQVAYPAVRAIIEVEGLPIAEGSTSFNRLAHAYSCVAVEAMSQLLERDAGVYREHSAHATELTSHAHVSISSPTTVHASAPTATRRSRGVAGDVLSAIYERYRTERQLPKRSLMEADKAIERFIEVNGDLPVRSIEKAQGREFKDALTKVPKKRVGRMLKMTVPELIAATENDAHIPRLSPATVNKQLNLVGAVFSWAIRNGYCDDNPVSNLSLKEPKAGRERRLPYDSHDLKLLFNSPLFTGCQSERQRWKPGPYVYRDSKFWLPLLGLYTGARSEELGQLLIRDIREKDGVQYIDINAEDESKSLKTKGSKRKVPIHPELGRFGFLAYVEAQRKHGQDAQLFPDLTLSKADKFTSPWSQWWGRYARGIGVTDRLKTYHSFRHTFKDACRDSDFPEDVNDALTGHVNGSVARSYGKGHSLSTLARHMDRLQYPGLDLTHLHIEEEGEAQGRAA